VTHEVWNAGQPGSDTEATHCLHTDFCGTALCF